MTSITIQAQAKPYLRNVPDVQPGYTVRVHEKIQEGGKERVQVFEGLVISVHRGHVPTDTSFTVRKVVSGIGVEKVFPLHSPVIEKIEVKKVAKIRRAKLFFIRGRTGKAARMLERFTTEGEFGSKTPEVAEDIVESDIPATQEEIVEAPQEAAVTEETETPAAENTEQSAA